MAVAGIGGEHTRLSGDGSEHTPVKSGTIGNARAAHLHLSALDTRTHRDHSIPLPQAGALHEPPDSPHADGRPAYPPATAAADTHVPYTDTSSAGAAALRDHDATDVDRLGSTPQPVDINASP